MKGFLKDLNKDCLEILLLAYQKLNSQNFHQDQLRNLILKKINLKYKENLIKEFIH